MNDNRQERWKNVLPPQDIATKAARLFGTACEAVIQHCIEQKLAPQQAVMTVAIALSYTLKTMGSLFANDPQRSDAIALKALQIMRSHILLLTNDREKTARLAMTDDIDSAVRAATLSNVSPGEIMVALCQAVSDLGGLETASTDNPQ